MLQSWTGRERASWGKVIKQRKMLQLRTGGREASWGKSDKTEEDAPIAGRRQRGELGEK